MIMILGGGGDNFYFIDILPVLPVEFLGKN